MQTCTSIISDSLNKILTENHEMLRKDNEMYKEEYERLKKEQSEQKQIWEKELEETKALISKLCSN